MGEVIFARLFGEDGSQLRGSCEVFGCVFDSDEARIFEESADGLVFEVYDGASWDIVDDEGDFAGFIEDGFEVLDHTFLAWFIVVGGNDHGDIGAALFCVLGSLDSFACCV